MRIPDKNSRIGLKRKSRIQLEREHESLPSKEGKGGMLYIIFLFLFGSLAGS